MPKPPQPFPLHQNFTFRHDRVVVVMDYSNRASALADVRPLTRWCGYVRAEVDGRFNRYALVDDRIREILATGESIIRGNADRNHAAARRMLEEVIAEVASSSERRDRRPLFRSGPSLRAGS